jgi:ribosomal protein S18 acetylase RimI-like enzyme
MPGLRFRRFDAQGARTLRQTIASIHSDAYAAAITSGDPFESCEAFMQRFDAHARNPSLDLVIAYAGSEPAGQVWGFPVARLTPVASPVTLPDEARPPGITHQDGDRVFALAEIMVRKAWTGQGIAHGLHDHLLAARTEQVAELYVRPENTAAYRAYLKWGWRRLGETRPDLPDAPPFDVLILPLPLTQPASRPR